MSSNGPYKSKLFNFVHQQTSRFNDQFSLAVRQLKVAAVWGAQIVLYPVYLVAQAARVVGNQLQQAAQQPPQQLLDAKPSPKQKPPTADTPIERVLNAIDDLPILDIEQAIREAIPAEIAHPASLETPAKDTGIVNIKDNSLAINEIERILNLSKPNQTAIDEQTTSIGQVVRGVASMLATRHLVLVANDNEIWDILSFEQQQKLRQRIILEVANFNRYLRLKQESKTEQKFIAATEVHKLAEKENVLPPVRFFWQVMAWVQTGPIAIAANIFQESNIVKQQETELENNFSPSSFWVEQLVALDKNVANFEEQGLLNNPAELTNLIGDRTNALLQLIQTKFSEIIPQNKQSPQTTANTEVNQQDKLQFQALIAAAVNYFFGNNNDNLPSGDSSPTSTFSANNTELEMNQLIISQELKVLPEGKNTSNQAIRKAILPGIGPRLSSPNNFLLVRTKTIIQRIQVKLKPKNNPIQSVTAEENQPETLQIQALIQAAVNYFFGNNNQTLPSTDSSQSIEISGNSEISINQLTGSETNLLPEASSGLNQAFAQRWQRINQQIKIKTNTIVQKIKIKIELGSGSHQLANNEYNQPETRQINALIQSAINYFFGNNSRQLSGTNLSINSNHQNQQQNIYQSEADLWLDENDLFGELVPPKTINRPQVKDDRQADEPENSLTNLQFPSSDLNQSDFTEKVNPSIDTPRTAKKPSKRKHKERKPAERQNISDSKSKSSKTSQVPQRSLRKSPIQRLAALEEFNPSESDLEHSPDWIETKATHVGYAKHPLEQLLEWLDRGMLWLEEIITTIWRSITRG